jgi:hypothetical protein
VNRLEIPIQQSSTHFITAGRERRRFGHVHEKSSTHAVEKETVATNGTRLESWGLHRGCGFSSGFTLRMLGSVCAMGTARKTASDGDADSLVACVCVPARRGSLARLHIGAKWGSYTLLTHSIKSFHPSIPWHDAGVLACAPGRCQQVPSC